MAKDIPEMESESLGDFLRRTRKEKGLDLQQIGAETKISASNLLAIEADDFSVLPADAFARGFYAIYAKALDLDADAIVARYTKEKSKQPNSTLTGLNSQAPGKVAKKVSSMAEPPSAAPVSIFGFLLLLIILLGAGICWYLNINPATYISERLRGLQHGTTIEGTKDSSHVTPTSEPATSTPDPKTTMTDGSLGQQPAMETTTEPSLTPGTTSKYLLRAEFPETTHITIKVDDNPARDLTFQAGEITHWNADTAIVVTLSAKTQVRLTLNDIPITLPPTSEEDVTLSIPEYLFE